MSTGIAFQIDDKHLSIFASSLRANSDAVCILFVDSSPSGRQKELLERNRIYSIQVDLHALRPSALHKYHASSLRWILFDRLLHATVRSEGGHLLINRRAIEERLYATSSHPSQRLFNQNFDRILTLDVRDSVFQSDPFSAMPALSLSNGQLIGEIIHLQGLPQPIVARLYTLLVFGEDEYVSIGMCGWNSGWVRDVFSEGVLSAIGSCPVICSGVSMGFNHAMVVYIHYMSLAMRGQRLPQFSREDEQDEWEELTQGENATITARKPIVATTQSGSAPRLSKYRYLSSAAVRKRIDNFREENRNAHLRPIGRSNEDVLEEINRQNQLPKTERNGVDQGVHNVLIYSNIIPALILYPANFPVINLQSALELRPFVIDRSAGGMLLAQQSRNPYVVVHQYDRLPDFQSILMERYVPWVNINDPMSEWRESSHCAPFSHSKDVDLLRGQCDAGSQRVMTLASCCEVCNRRAGRTTEDLGRSPADLYTKSPLAGATACTGFAYVGGVCFFKNCGVEGVKNALSHVALGNAMAGFLREPGAVSGYLTP